MQTAALFRPDVVYARRSIQAGGGSWAGRGRCWDGRKANERWLTSRWNWGSGGKSIGEWVRLSEEAGDSIFEDERAELRRLRKELRELRMGKILAKATAFREWALSFLLSERSARKPYRSILADAVTITTVDTSNTSP